MVLALFALVVPSFWVNLAGSVSLDLSWVPFMGQYFSSLGFVNLLLGVIMFGMGMTLRAEDFALILRRPGDVLVGIAASGRTPYVLGGLDYAKSVGCHTAAIACNIGSAIGKAAELAIEVNCGPEVLTGSTRLKSGTAQKLILNMISTGSMVRTGKAYQNLMVDVQQTNEKLHTRAENIVIDATGVEREKARAAIDAAGGSVKTAITMLLADCDAAEAARRLERAFSCEIPAEVYERIGKELESHE